MSISHSEHTHFDDIAAVYDASLPPHVVEHYLRKRAAFVLGLGSYRTVLDVGCGTGALARRLTGLGYDVTGVDPSEGMLGVMRSRAPEVRAVHGSGTELPFDPDSFDVVVSVAAFHHIAEPDAVSATLAEMTRRLEARGPDRDLGPQPAQPLLVAADEPGPARTPARSG